MPIDYETDVGRVRLLIPDIVEAELLFTDEQVGVFLAMEGGVKKAAALALETVASSEVMVSKVIRTQDLSTDGAKVSDALLKRAASLRQQADDEADLDAGAFIIVDMVAPFQRHWPAEASEAEEG